MVAQAGHALAAEGQFEPPSDPDRLSDTLSALARKHQVPGAVQLQFSVRVFCLESATSENERYLMGAPALSA